MVCYGVQKYALKRNVAFLNDFFGQQINCCILLGTFTKKL